MPMRLVAPRSMVPLPDRERIKVRVFVSRARSVAPRSRVPLPVRERIEVRVPVSRERWAHVACAIPRAASGWMWSGEEIQKFPV